MREYLDIPRYVQQKVTNKQCLMIFKWKFLDGVDGFKCFCLKESGFITS